MVEPLIKKQLNPQKVSIKPCGVLMGRTGAGKTTLANKLCGTNHKSGAARGSVTQELYRNDVSCGQYAFSLIDTPGTDSSTETYKHALLLKEGLTATKINTVFIIIKYDNRFEKMVEIYFEVKQSIHKYEKKVVLLISHWDTSKNPENDFKEICEAFIDECPNIENIICFSEKSSDTQIANLMYSCMSNMKVEILQITDEEFCLHFNIYQMRSQMKVVFGQYQKKANLLVEDYTKLINTVKSESVEDKDEVLHMIIVQFKNEMETFLHDFKQQHGSAMQELDYYAFYIKMQKENVKICDEFVEKVVPLMSYNLFDNKDPRNLIKKCPHCGLIWYKTEGCDGSTTCGNSGFSNYFDVSVKPFWRYLVQRINGELRWEKNSAEKKAPVKSAEKNGNSRRMGCGQTIIWGELPKLEDDLILELFKVKTIDEAKQLIQADSFKDIRRNYENNINLSFQS